MSAVELNLDGIVGPTHNYAGLSRGNLASTRSAGLEANPRAAAIEGLVKMKTVADLGVPQAVFPPQDRPDLGFLRALGFTGSDESVLNRAAKDAPDLLAAASSASSMWMANAATVSPSADCDDGRVHFTPANLTSQMHRTIEPPATARLLKSIFDDVTHFAHHEPLPGASHLSDEGAANHLRLCPSYGEQGVEIFIYGRSRKSTDGPERFSARQSLEASEAIVRRHRVRSAILLQQHPSAIDQGVFHNDVVAVCDRETLFIHEAALLDQTNAIARIRATCSDRVPFRPISVSERELSVEKAVDTYLFNSQLVTLPDGKQCLVAPSECQRDADAKAAIDRIISEGEVDRAVFVDVRQSMRNGGGPACLRLRVPLTEAELAAMHRGMRFTDELYDRLVSWVQRHYRDRLTPADLADPNLQSESREALDELTVILNLGTAYRFQQ